MDWHRYELMCQCWSVERENRPTFTKLKMRLKALEISMRRKQGTEIRITYFVKKFLPITMSPP